MATRTLELNINSASNLTNTNLFTNMNNVYAVITLNGDYTRLKQKVKTSVDSSGGSNPTWNQDIKFSFNERLALDGLLTLSMRLMISRRVLGNKEIGEVNVPLLELLNSIPPLINGNGYEMKFMTYRVRTGKGKRIGSLTFSFRFPPPSEIEHPPLASPELPYGYALPSPTGYRDEGPSCQRSKRDRTWASWWARDGRFGV